MNDIVLRADRLSKQYRIGQRRHGYHTMRDAIVSGLAAPFAWARRRGTADAGDGTIWALKDVSFEIRRGEVVGIVGANGAGKSTLLKVLSRITEPTSGFADVTGRVGSLLEVGTGFHPELTGTENIFLSGAILGMRRRDTARLFDDIVAFAEVDRFIDTPVKHYSSGMYLRLAFAVAAHLDPEILLVDEVLAVGDAAFQKKCLGKMGSVAKDGRTVLFVSHNLGAIANLCDRSILLSDGGVEMIGANSAVIDRYLTDALRRGGSDAVDLSVRSDRKGAGRLRFTGVAMRDGSERPVSDLRAGEAATFEMAYRIPTTTEQAINGLFEIKIHDQSGYLLVTLSTYLQGQHLEIRDADGTVSCQVPNLLLGPGIYSCTLIAFTNGVLSDEVHDAFQFTVIESDFYESGKLPKRRIHGPLLMPHAWHATDAETTPTPV